jgi:hypothetical protein
VVAAPEAPPEAEPPEVVALPAVPPPELEPPVMATAPAALTTGPLGAPSLEQAQVTKVPHTEAMAVMYRLSAGALETVSTGARLRR